MTSDEDFLRSLLQRATADLQAPAPHARPGANVTRLTPAAPDEHRGPAHLRRGASGRASRGGRGRSWPRTATAVAVGAAAALAVVFGIGGTTAPEVHPLQVPVATGVTSTSEPAGRHLLLRLAAATRVQAAPQGRYVVQIEVQTEGKVRYLKASVIDSHNGNTWTYQQGDGVPATLPMAPGFSPSEKQLQAQDPTDPRALRAALIAQARAAGPSVVGPPPTPEDLAVTQALNTLWNPLVQPALRAALVTVIAEAPGVRVDPHATDARGRPAIEISYRDTALEQTLAVYVDASTGFVLESAQRSYATTAPLDGLGSGSDVYLSQYWTNQSPTVDPLGG